MAADETITPQTAIGFQRAGRLAEAQAVWLKLLEQSNLDNLTRGAIHSNLGFIAGVQQQPQQALEHLREAARLRPRDAVVHANLALALLADDRIEETAAACRRAMMLDNHLLEPHVTLGHAFRAQRRIGDAIACYRQAMRIDPRSADAHHMLGMGLLAGGQFAEGWRDTNGAGGHARAAHRRGIFGRPQWDGADLAGKTILLHAEQGAGDSIQFVRYVPLVFSRGRPRIVLEVPASLERLFRSILKAGAAEIENAFQIVPTGQPLPAFDVHCPLMSLPLPFATTPATIPAQSPYLYADPADVELWQSRLKESGPRRRIGLAWAGNPTHGNDRNRSAALSQLAPLAAVDATFFSLQVGPASAQAAHPPPGMTLTDHTAHLHDFADTAAFIACLDVVISVDTSVAHLAGALGKAGLLMLPFPPEWRWWLSETESPWYPTLRLFRQPQPKDWPAVAELIAQTLQNPA